MDRDARQILTEFLVLRVQAGEAQAFAALHSLWARDLQRLAAVQLREPRDVDEVAQDAWVAVARGIARLEDPACFARWAFRILERRCADLLRRQHSERRRTVPLPDERDLPAAPPPAVAEDEDVTALRAAIAALDLEARKLLHLVYDADLSLAEVAEVLGVPVGTVKSRLFAVRASLRRRLHRGDRDE